MPMTNALEQQRFPAQVHVGRKIPHSCTDYPVMADYLIQCIRLRIGNKFYVHILRIKYG